jgi:hypothetical protein
MMKLHIAIAVFLISTMAQAGQVDYKFCLQTLKKIAAEHDIPWAFKKSFSNESADGFQYEKVDVKDKSGVAVEVTPTIEDGRLQTVKLNYSIELCQGTSLGLTKAACKYKVIDFKIDPQSNPCEFERITFEDHKGEAVERKPVMTKKVCQAIRDYLKLNPTKEVTDFANQYVGGLNSGWKETFNLTYSMTKPATSGGQLKKLEENCQKYSPSETAAAPATATGQVPIVPKSQPAAK